MAELDYISIQGFRSIQKLERLPLRPINILIGANGSGKSNFISAFGLLRSIRDGTLQQYVERNGGAARMLHFGPKRTGQIQLNVLFKKPQSTYSVVLQPTSEDRFVLAAETLSAFKPNGDDASSLARQDDVKIEGREELREFLRKDLASWRIYHFHDTGPLSPLKQNADINDNHFLRADGKNLAAFLYLLREKHRASYDLIVQTVMRVAPFFRDFNLAPLQLNPSQIRLEWLHTNSDDYFDAASLSDGTLRFIALATLLLMPPTFQPSVILLDEPELGLHPFAITILAGMARSVSARSQVILSTQSPQLLDHFEPEDVLVAERVTEATVFRRLDSDHLKGWLEDYSMGQLWEKNELGGRPSSLSNAPLLGRDQIVAEPNR